MWLITTIKSQLLVGKPGSLNCRGHRHNSSSSQASNLPPSVFSRASHRPKKRDTRRRNRNCKYIKMYCQYLPHQGFMDLEAFFFFLWFMYKLKLHTIAALAFKCKQNILVGYHSVCWRVGLWTLRCERRPAKTSSCLRIRARHGVRERKV